MWYTFIMNEQLVEMLKALTADTVALKFKAHGYHWNVEGDDFPQWHEKFGEIYADFDDAIDDFAEWIRKIDVNSYAPFALSRYVELSSVPETTVSSDSLVMAADLCESIELITDKIVAAAVAATAANQFGLANFLGDRQTMHQKWCWQLEASCKPVGE
jgi:starvation-inducible DNA-binding protein